MTFTSRKRYAPHGLLGSHSEGDRQNSWRLWEASCGGMSCRSPSRNHCTAARASHAALAFSL
jgi:hypothetical protein